MTGITIGQRVETTRSLDYLWIFWKLHGCYPDAEYNFFQKLHVVFVFVVVNFVNMSTFLIQLFFMRNLKQLLNNVPMNVSLIADALKFLSILKMRKQIIVIPKYFAELDKSVAAPEHVEKIKRLVSFCKRIIVFVSIAYQSIIIAAAVNAAVSHREILLFDVWIPYDFHDPGWVYWITFLFQFIFMMGAAIQNATNDLCPPLYFIMLNGHLEILMDRIQNIGWDLEKTPEENTKELIVCIKAHRSITRVFGTMQDTISYSIFIQLASTAIVLSLEVLLFLLYPPTLTEIALVLFFILDSTLEVLPCCYYSNQFMLSTDRTVTAIYSSNFPDQTMEFKKIAIIFMQMTQKSRVVIAGKFVPVTLATFASMLKLSYTLLTLANQLR